MYGLCNGHTVIYWHLTQKNISNLIQIYISFTINNQTQPDNDCYIKIHTCGDVQNIRRCNGPTIEKVTCIKHLGVIVDQRLSWYLEEVSSRLENKFLKLYPATCRSKARHTWCINHKKYSIVNISNGIILYIDWARGYNIYTYIQNKYMTWQGYSQNSITSKFIIRSYPII